MTPVDATGAVTIRDRGPRYRANRFEIVLHNRDADRSVVIFETMNQRNADILADITRGIVASWMTP